MSRRFGTPHSSPPAVLDHSHRGTRGTRALRRDWVRRCLTLGLARPSEPRVRLEYPR